MSPTLTAGMRPGPYEIIAALGSRGISGRLPGRVIDRRRSTG